MFAILEIDGRISKKPLADARLLVLYGNREGRRCRIVHVFFEKGGN